MFARPACRVSPCRIRPAVSELVCVRVQALRPTFYVGVLRRILVMKQLDVVKTSQSCVELSQYQLLRVMLMLVLTKSWC